MKGDAWASKSHFGFVQKLVLTWFFFDAVGKEEAKPKQLSKKE